MSKVEIYIFHSIDDVVMGFFKGDSLLDHSFVSKKEIGEKWVEEFSRIMKNNGIDLVDVGAIYLNLSFSTWNASRLITLFVKTIVSFGNTELFIREESQDKLDGFSSLKSFCKNRKNFRRLESALELSPLYKKCPNINI